MYAEEVAEEQRQVQNKLLVSGIAVHVSALQIQGEWDDFSHTRESLGKHYYQFLVVRVLRTDLKAADFSQTLQCDITSFRRIEEPFKKGVDDRCLENIAEGNPVKKSE